MQEPPTDIEDDFMNDEIGGNDIGFGNGQGEMNDTNENPFDSNFDAGVEADEEEDPKKFIEQLSGKLSQSLRKYQEGLPQPDADTAKFAAGMVVKAAIDGLSDEDVKDILDKIKEGDNEEEPKGDENEMTDDFEMPEDDFQGEELGESVMNRRKIDELFNQIMNNGDVENDVQKKPLDRISYKKKPFTSPNF